MAAEISFQNFVEHKVATDESLDSIAKDNGITWQQLAQFNWATSNPQDINICLHDLVGCLHTTKNRKNYIFTSGDRPGIVYVPIKSQDYTLAAGASHKIEVTRPRLRSDVEVETVDEFRNPVGNVSLVLKRKEGGPDVEITTDDKGYGKAAGVLTGHYEASVKGGGPAYFLAKTLQPANDDPDADTGVFDEAVIDTRHRTDAVTQLVVERTSSKGEKQGRRLLQREYTRMKPVVSQGRGNETASDTQHSYNRLRVGVAIDNLALLAGWSGDNIDISNLVSDVMPDFLQDYGATADARSYYVWVIEPYAKPPQISLYSNSGKKELSFQLTANVRGLFGAYATYEKNGGWLFVDVISKSASIPIAGHENEYVPIDMLVAESDRSKFNDATIRHAELQQVPIVYILPTGKQLEQIGFHGGCGRLEDYGHNDGVNARIHERNKNVCKVISRLYNGYVNAEKTGYVARVRATTNEKELRALGAPWAPYAMPAPANATTSQIIDIYSSYDVELLKPWDAVARQLDRFANRMTEGLPFISLKAKYEIGVGSKATKNLAFITGLLGTSNNEPIPTAIEMEGKLTFQFSDEDIRTFTGVESKSKASFETQFKGEDEKYKIGLEFKRNLAKPEEWEVTLKTGPLELEAGKAGNRKVAIEVFPEIWTESEADPGKATFEGGLKIETKAILHLLKKLPVKSDALSKFVQEYGEKVIPAEVSIHAGFVGLTERTALSVVSCAPGFFDVRDPDVLVTMKWNNLAPDEEVHLVNLGWDMCTWDLKTYGNAELPETMEEEWEEFTAEEKVATLFLGFYDADDYHKRVNDSRSYYEGWEEGLKALHCTREEGEGEGKEKGEGAGTAE